MFYRYQFGDRNAVKHRVYNTLHVSVQQDHHQALYKIGVPAVENLSCLAYDAVAIGKQLRRFGGACSVHLQDPSSKLRCGSQALSKGR